MKGKIARAVTIAAIIGLSVLAILDILEIINMGNF